MAAKKGRSIIRSFSLTEREVQMLERVARYHGLSKSGTVRALVRKEFWRIFPAGTDDLKPEQGARITGEGNDDD